MAQRVLGAILLFWLAGCGVTELPRPLPPEQLTAAAGPQSATISWAAADPNGGPAISGYLLERTPAGALLQLGPVTSTVVTELTDGVAYTFTLRAVNANGTSERSLPSVPVTPGVVASAPRNVAADRGDGSILVHWEPPLEPGTGERVAYELRAVPDDGALLTASPSAGSYRVEGLTNGLAYAFQVRTRTTFAPGAWSEASPAVIPATTPSAPLNVRARPADGTVTLEWDPPTSAGGEALSSFELRWTPGDGVISLASSARSAQVPALENGTDYAFTLAALNALGPGLASVVTARPRTVPSPPQAVTSERGDRTVTIRWAAPASDGGEALGGFHIVGAPGNLDAVVPGDARAVEFTGLVNGTAYSFEVVATNAAGASAPAAAPAVIPATVPAPPQILAALPGDEQLTLQWVPMGDGGEPITAYVVRDSSGAIWQQLPPTTTELTIAPLANGIEATFSVEAVNAVGASLPVSRAGTPVGLPEAPTLLLAEGADHGVTLHWEPPADTGGAPIDAYLVELPSERLAATVAGDVRSHTFGGLEPGTAYTLQVSAVNRVGPGPAAQSLPVEAQGPPSAPTSLVATSGDLAAALSWGPPVNLGGLAVLDYEISTGSRSFRTSELAWTLAPLRNGRPSELSVRARNALGLGPAATTVVTPHAAPGLSNAWLSSARRECPVIGASLSRSAPAGTDVRVEFDAGAGWRTARQAPQRTGLGPQRRRQTAEFHWDALSDLGAFAGTVQLRLTPVASDEPDVTGPVRLLSASVDTRAAVWLGQLGGPPAASAPVLSADVNTDGRTDAIWLGPRGEIFSQLTSDGVTWQPRLELGRTLLTARLAVADVNRDSRVDLVVASSAGLVLLLGRGDGTFFENRRTALTLPAAEVLVDDVDRDGWPDAVIVDGAGSVSTFPGVGGAPAIASSLGTTLRRPHLADVDRDGRLDLLALSGDGGAVVVALGDGAGAFAVAAPTALSAPATDLTLADLDGNGLADLLVSLGAAGSAVMFALPAGGLGPEAPLCAQPAGHLFADDANGDGRVDLWAADGAVVSLLERAAPGVCTELRTVTAAGSIVELIPFGDPDLDGDLDLLISDAAAVEEVRNDSTHPCGRKFEGVGMLHDAALQQGPDLPVRDVTIADFNGDGRLDVAGSVSRYHGSWSFIGPYLTRAWLGMGDGTFWSEPHWSRDSWPSREQLASTAAIDLDGDGAAELVGTIPAASRLVAYAIGENGAFAELDDLWLAPDLPQCVRSGDFDGDGLDELAVGTASGELLVFEPTFAGAAPYLRVASRSMLGAGVCRAEVADLDGDAYQDYVFLDDAQAHVAHALPAGGFAPPLPVGGPPPAFSSWPVAQDFDGDGALDVGYVSVRDLVMLPGQPGGGFAAAVVLASFPTSLPQSFGVSVDTDGTRRMLVRTNAGDVVGVLSGRGFVPGAALDHSASAREAVVQPADLDGDGVDDLLVCSSTGSHGTSRVYLWTARELRQPPVATAFSFAQGIGGLAAADIDHDGCPDLWTVDSGAVAVAHGRCDGTFAPPSAPVRAPVAAMGGSAEVDSVGLFGSADFDRDGVDDVLAPLSGGIYFFRGDRNGGFAAPTLATAGGWPLEVGDVNRDGRLDLMLGNWLRLGRGDGTFGDAPVSPVVSGEAYALGDLNDDGVLDVVATGNDFETQNPDVRWQYGNSDGSFQDPGRRGVWNYGRQVAIHDLDRDGHNDLAVAVHGETTGDRGGVSWLRREGSSFRGSLPAEGLPGVDSMVIQDLDHDAYPDFLTGSERGSSVSVSWAYPDLSTTEQIQLVAGDSPKAVIAADFNADGRPDLAALQADRRTVRVYLAH